VTTAEKKTKKEQRGVEPMADVLSVVGTVAFFGLMALFAKALEKA
jgi:hypothetical protein